MAGLLNSTFSLFDGVILSSMHDLAVWGGAFFTPLFKAITFIGEKGLIFFILALAFMLFPKTRRQGICIFGAVACGALITNFILKDMVARLRPFQSSPLYEEFWNFLGSPKEDGFSFPSGHTTAFMAGATAIFITSNKKWSWAIFLGALLMGVSRIYLMAHYPSDVLFGFIIGLVSGIIAWLITNLIYKILNKHSNNKFCSFVLNASISQIFKK